MEALTANKVLIELARNSGIFLSGMEGGLKEADEIGLNGKSKLGYSVQTALIETITERMSSFGLEAQALGLPATNEGIKEFIKSIIEEGSSEALAEIGGVLLNDQYGVVSDLPR